MHGLSARLLRRLASQRRQRDERGAVAIILALAMVGIIVAVGMVVDFGLVKDDRQVDKSAADAAALAGAEALATDGSSAAHPYAGVCAAIRYLRVADPRFGSLDPNTGWTNGLGASEPSGCTSTTLRQAWCVPGQASSWAVYKWAGTWQGMPISVTIQSGYSLVDSGWAEDSLPASVADDDDGAQGCDQIATIITQHRHATFGALAGAHDMATSVRSVARGAGGPGRYAPALLLLNQTGCSVLTTKGNGSIEVTGAIASNGVAVPGTIHADSDGSGCGSSGSIFSGSKTASIVADAAPLVSNPTAADPSKPGQITSYAAETGKSGTVVRNSSTDVCGSTALTKACPGVDVTGQGLVTREPVDARYLAAVQTIRDTADAVFAAPASVATYTTTDCSPNAAEATLTVNDVAYIDCTSGFGGKGGTINAGTVIIAGPVTPKGAVTMPNATHVYVVGAPAGAKSADAISLQDTGAAFSMHTSAPSGASNLDATGKCSQAATGVPDKAVLVVEGGGIDQQGGSLQMCYTTVLLEGGVADACLPTAPSRQAPDPSTACDGSSGNGAYVQEGNGNVDWTAPNQYDAIDVADGTPDPTKAQAWADPNGPEDLALWSESGVEDEMRGNAGDLLVGVVMVPNANVDLAGTADQSLVDTQYIADTVSLTGNSTITMRVDPESAVTVPQLAVVGLVR